MTQPKALLLDSIVRIYKNNAGRVIGLHTVSIHEQREQSPGPIPSRISNSRFKRSATVTSEFDRFNLSMGESRIIATIQMIGKYDDFTYNNSGNDIVSIRYLGNNEVNDIEVSLLELPTIGETI